MIWADWLALIRKLTGAGLLIMDMAGHGGLQMTAEGRRLLAGEGGGERCAVADRETDLMHLACDEKVA